MADSKNPLDDAKAWWAKQPQQTKLMIGGGAALVLVLLIVAMGNGGGGNAGYAPYRQGYPGQAYQGQGYPGQGYQGQGDQGQGEQGYVGQGYQGQPGGGYAPNNGGQAEGDDPTGYWGRQRSQEQQARSFDGYINDTNTVRNNDTGEVTTDVPNTYADPAIESGGYSAVPTAELPTTTPAPAETPAE